MSFYLLIAICLILSILYMEQFFRFKNLKRLFHKMERRFFKQQQHKDQFLAEMTKTDLSNVRLDALTGLPETQVFTDRLVQAVNQSRRHKMSFAVMRLDINELSAINDQQGYEVGDKILLETAERLKKVIRQVDTVCRYIGSNFVFLLPLLSKPETAAYVAQRAQDSIMKPYNINGKEISLTASIGIAIFPSDGQDSTNLLKNAEAALQQSKNDGKNAYQFFQKELQILGHRELTLSSSLRSSTVTEQLKVFYQPHIDLETNSIFCIQAILYLKHPEFGLIPFKDFFKLAENTGKIVEVGEWLLSESITQFKKWENEGFKPRYMSISVSLKQIEDPRFLLKLSQVLQETNFDAHKLVFEISENILVENSAAVDSGFSMLTRLGIKLSIGVYALGHFALNKISTIPLDFLKIDGRLIQDVASHNENKNILGLIISLANDSEIIVIADGIELEKQMKLLKHLGCTIMQGKLFGNPEEQNAVLHEYRSIITI